MSIEKNPINTNVNGTGYITFSKEIGLGRCALRQIMHSRLSMSKEEMQKIQNYFINNLPLNSLNHFDISEFSEPRLKKTTLWYPISAEVRSKIQNGIREIQEKNGHVVVVNNETLKARTLTKRIDGLPQDLLNRIIDRRNPKAVITITPKNFKKIDQFFRTHLPNNPNLLEESDIVRVNQYGKKLDADACTKTKKIMYSITDTVITKIKGCINAFDNTENVDTTAIDRTKKKRTKFEVIDNSKVDTNQPQNEGFSEKRTKPTLKTTNNQPFATQNILAFENPLLNSQFLPMSFLPIETVQPNNVENEIIENETKDKAPIHKNFKAAVNHPPEKPASNNNIKLIDLTEKVKPLNQVPVDHVAKKAKTIPNSHKSIPMYQSFFLEEAFPSTQKATKTSPIEDETKYQLPAAQQDVDDFFYSISDEDLLPSTDHQASSTQNFFDELRLFSSSGDNVFTLNSSTTWND